MNRFVLSMVCLLAYSTPVVAADYSNQARPVDMVVSTTPTLEGYKIKEYLGIVRGVTVRQPTIGQGLSAGLERLKGGHISAYVAMCETARQQAYDQCLERARALKADAVVGVKYDSSSFDAGGNVASEVTCYGTAVTVERNVANSNQSSDVREGQRIAANDEDDSGEVLGSGRNIPLRKQLPVENKSSVGQNSVSIKQK